MGVLPLPPFRCQGSWGCCCPPISLFRWLLGLRRWAASIAAGARRSLGLWSRGGFALSHSGGGFSFPSCTLVVSWGRILPFRALRPWESRSPAAWRASSSTFASSPRSPRLTAAPACAAASASPSCWIFIPSSLLLGRGHDFAPPARPAPFERGFFRAVRLVGACRANCRTRQISFVAGRIGVTLPLDVSTSSLLLGGGRDLALPARSAPFGRGFRRGGCLVGACRPVAALGARFRRRWGRRRRAAAGTFPV